MSLGGSANWPTSDALLRRLGEIQQMTKPGSKLQARMNGGIRKIIEEDHRDKLERQVTRYGQPMAPLAPATLRKRGPGKTLIPRGPASWPLRTFFVYFADGPNGQNIIIARYDQDPKIVKAHEKGATKPGTRWRLPARPTMGITPKGWARIRALVKSIPEQARIWGGGRGF